MAEATALLEVRDVTKSFGAVAAVQGVSFPLLAGEAHALVGENGAGKSTIVKMLAGVHRPDTGTLLVGGAEVEFGSPADAKAAGIAVIYQEPTLFPDLSVAENIAMGNHPLTRLRQIDRTAMRETAERLFRRLGVDLDPDRPARGLSIADQQLVEIAKALNLPPAGNSREKLNLPAAENPSEKLNQPAAENPSEKLNLPAAENPSEKLNLPAAENPSENQRAGEARILIMDEPTAALSAVEVERLFAVVRALRDEGAAILFISHRFEEITALCERVTIMRDGKHVATELVAELSVDDMIRRMVGRDLSALFPKQQVAPGEVLLEVEGLSREGVFRDVSFSVRAGEIVALAGLVGAGRSEVMQAVFGVDPYDNGTVKVGGKRLKPHSPRAAMAAGVALVPEDRRQQGLIMELSIERNVTLPRARKLARLGLLLGGAEREAAATWTRKLQTKLGSLSDAVGTLSGGNQQKVVLAKWLSTGPRLLIVDEPTRGIDVGTKAEVHRLMSALAADGLAIVMVSSELPEVLGMADRVIVLREGRVAAELSRAEATEESVMYAAMGQAG